jgi:endonuclease/exonuclease/phosphatase family metal-dependent hydrolase
LCPLSVSIECNLRPSLRILASLFLVNQRILWRGIVIFLCTLRLLGAGPAFAADTLRVVTYNTLNYPGTSSSIRNPDFRKTFRRIDPDIAIVQEMTSQAGMNEFLAQVFNVIAPGRYVAVPFHDGPDTDNGLFYDSSRVGWVSASYIATALRDIAEYVVRVKSSGDTMRIYSLHLKASSGATNEEARRVEATILRNHLNGLPAGSLFIVVGDYNIYRSSEPAFVKLLGSESDNDGRCFDQLNLVGTWNDAAFAPYHTQSPRVRAFDGGSTGGMDDRFDIILSSDAMRSHLLTSSITAFGNDGNHFNDSINRLPNAAVPDSIANALHYASDHLPVHADIVFNTLPATPPVAFTDSAGSITATSAVLNGSVNPEGSVTYVRFAWGRGTAFTDSTSVQTVGPGTNIVPVSAGISGLTSDTIYSFTILAVNSGGSALGSVRTLSTPPLPPAPPLLVAPVPGAEIPLGTVQLVWRSVAGATSFRVQLAANAGFTPPLVADTTLTDTTCAVNGLSVGVNYFWRVQAGNPGGAGSFSLARAFTLTNAVTGQFTVFSGWNLLSLPYRVADPTRPAVYPQATSRAYGFSQEAGYFEEDSLALGTGFWLKFDADQQVSITGTPVTGDSIPVQTGWNLVGAISSPADVGSLTTIPPEIIVSSFFEYNGTYIPAETLLPGQAYWVKSSGPGIILVQAAVAHRHSAAPQRH